MKDILNITLESKYKLTVLLIDESGPLAVRIDNSKDEFVGQIFTSFDSLAENVERLSNYEYKLSDDEKKTIESEVIKATDGQLKPKGESRLDKLMTSRDRVQRHLAQFEH